MRRPLEQWKAILRGKNNNDAAERIISDLVGYRSTSLHRLEDVEQLATAMTAWSQLQHVDPSDWHKCNDCYASYATEGELRAHRETVHFPEG